MPVIFMIAVHHGFTLPGTLLWSSNYHSGTGNLTDRTFRASAGSPARPAHNRTWKDAGEHWSTIGTMRLAAVIFDMDNTLFDFISAKRHACRMVAATLGRTDGEDLFSYFLHSAHGFESHQNICDYLKDRLMYSDEIFHASCRIYEERKLAVLRAYPGVHEVLGHLRKNLLKTAIVTDAHNGNARARLERLQLYGYFDCVITTEMTGRKKPAREPFLLALRSLSVQPQETLLVGDSLRRDIAPAKALGMLTAHAKYGDQNIPDYVVDQKPDYTLQDVRDLLHLLPLSG
jgi:putative hydrolase of the HAD superfamily